MLGHHRHTSEMPFKWRFAGGPMLARILWYLDPLSSHQLKKNVVKVISPLAKLSGSAHDMYNKFSANKYISKYLKKLTQKTQYVAPCTC